MILEEALDWRVGLLGLGLFLLVRHSKKSGGDGKKYGGGRIWSKDGAAAFEAFDFEGNGIAIDTDCERVAEGRHFFPFDWSTLNTRAEEAPTLDATLNVARDNTALGFIDYLTDTEGVGDPLVIAARILDEVSPQCASVPEAQWSPQLSAWYSSLIKRITDYVGQETIG